MVFRLKNGLLVFLHVWLILGTNSVETRSKTPPRLYNLTPDSFGESDTELLRDFISK